MWKYTDRKRVKTGFLFFSYIWQIHVTGTFHSPYKLNTGEITVPTENIMYC
jgi:hypothetical protein